MAVALLSGLTASAAEDANTQISIWNEANASLTAGHYDQSCADYAKLLAATDGFRRVDSRILQKYQTPASDLASRIQNYAASKQYAKACIDAYILALHFVQAGDSANAEAYTARALDMQGKALKALKEGTATGAEANAAPAPAPQAGPKAQPPPSMEGFTSACGVPAGTPLQSYGQKCLNDLYTRGLEDENEGKKVEAAEAYRTLLAIAKQMDYDHMPVGMATNRLSMLERDLVKDGRPPEGDLPLGRYMRSSLGPATAGYGGTKLYLTQSAGFLQVEPGRKYVINAITGHYDRSGDSVRFTDGALAGATGKLTCKGDHL